MKWLKRILGLDPPEPLESPFVYVENDDVENMQRLLWHNRKYLYERDSYNSTPLHRVKSRKMAELLFSMGADINAQGWMWGTPLYKAISNREVALFLIKKGADVNATTNRGWTPLHFVRDVEVAEALLRKGARLEAVGDFSATPLLRAVYDQREEIVRFLIERGADLSARNSIEGNNALQEAASQPHPGIVALLLDSGMDINSVNDEGLTALHIAARHGSQNTHFAKAPDVARLLLARGADPNILDKNGRKPIDYANQMQDWAMSELLAGATSQPAADNSLTFDELRLACVLPFENQPEIIAASWEGILVHGDLSASTPVVRSSCEYRFPPATGLGWLNAEHSKVGVVTRKIARNIVALNDGGIEITNVEPIDTSEVAERYWIPCYANFSRRGKWFAIDLGMEEIRLFRQDKEEFQELEAGERNHSFAFSPDERFIAVAASFQGGGSVNLYDLQSNDVPQLCQEWWRADVESSGSDFVDTLAGVAFSTDSRHLALFETSAIYHDCKPPGWRGNLVLFDVERESPLWQLSIDAELTGDTRSLHAADACMGFITEPCFLNGGQQVACGITRGLVLVFDAATGELHEKRQLVDSDGSPVPYDICRVFKLCDGSLWALTASSARMSGKLYRVE